MILISSDLVIVFLPKTYLCINIINHLVVVVKIIIVNNSSSIDIIFMVVGMQIILKFL